MGVEGVIFESHPPNFERFFDISTGFRFLKISVECSVHLCSCPCLGPHFRAVLKISAILLKYPTFEGFFFMGKANIKLNILNIVGSALKSWSVGMYNFDWDFTFTNTSTHHSRVIFLLLFCRGIVVSHRTAPFVQQYFVRPHKDSTFGTTWEIANTLYRPVIFACKSTKKHT